MATTATKRNNVNIASITTTSNYCSQPIKIPLGERFATQLSTGSADSGVVVGTASQKTSLQSLDIRSTSGSLSIHGPYAKTDLLLKLRQPASCSQLLSQDSGIDGGGALRRSDGIDSAPGSQTHLKCSSTSSNESLGANSSGISSSKFSEDGAESENSSAISAPCRRLKYKTSVSTIGICGTQGLEDPIEEVDIPDDYDDEDEGALEAEEEEGMEEDDDDDNAGIVVKIPLHSLESTTRKEPAGAIVSSLVKDHETEVNVEDGSAATIPAKLQSLNKATMKSDENQGKQVLATDGNYYFPLLKISDDPHIDAKLINKKDGLQDTMYYLDEFGSPKLREKYVRKQKQKELKQQKSKAKKKNIKEERPKLITLRTERDVAGDVEIGIESAESYGVSSSEPYNCSESATNCDCKDLSLDNTFSKNSSKNKSVTAEAVIQKLDGDDESDTDELNQESSTKSSSTPSCVSWTKVMQKFKNIIGKQTNKL